MRRAAELPGDLCKICREKATRSRAEKAAAAAAEHGVELLEVWRSLGRDLEDCGAQERTTAKVSARRGRRHCSGGDDLRLRGSKSTSIYLESRIGMHRG